MKRGAKWEWLLVAAASALSACGGTDIAVNTAADPPGINSVTVQGTSTPLLGGAQPIDPSQNGGHFSVSWDVTPNPGAELYTASLRVAHSSNGAGPVFFQIQTNAGCGHSGCSDMAPIDCTFDSSNRISCNGGSATDLTSFFGQLPENDFIVFSFQTVGSSSSPNEASVAVQFR